MPDIDVVIPFLGTNQDLKELIRSLVIHEFIHYIIIIEDKDCDHKTCNGVSVVKQTGAGLYNAMNSSFPFLVSKHCIFIGQTDIFLVDKFVEAVDFLRNCDSHIMCPVVISGNENSNPERQIENKSQKRPHHQGFIFLSRFFKNCKYEEKWLLHSDFDVMLKAVKHGVQRLEYPLVKFEVGGRSTNKRNIISSILEFHEIQQIHKISIVNKELMYFILGRIKVAYFN